MWSWSVWHCSQCHESAMNKRMAFGTDAALLFYFVPSFLFSPSSLGCLALTHPLPAVWPAPERHQHRITGSSFRRTSRTPPSFSCTAAADQQRWGGEERRWLLLPGDLCSTKQDLQDVPHFCSLSQPSTIHHLSAASLSLWLWLTAQANFILQPACFPLAWRESIKNRYNSHV